MARAVKKVKNVNAKHSKKFKAILASSITLGVIIIGVLVGLLIWDTYFNDDSEDYEYFSEYSANKINYDTIAKKIEKSGVEYIFIFAYSNSAFDAQEDSDDDDYTSTDNQIEDAVKVLYDAVNSKNEAMDAEIFSFYLLNVDLVGNSSFSEATEYGALGDTPCLVYIENSVYTDKVDDVKVSGTNVVNGENSSLAGYLKAAASYVAGYEQE